MADEYARVIQEEFADENAALSEFRQRAVGVVTTSGALVTLLTGLVAIAVGSSSHRPLSGVSDVFLILAIVAFLVAAGLALYVNVPKDVSRADIASLRELTEDKWDDSPFEASLDVANLRIDELESMRGVNKTHERVLAWAIGAEIVAVFLLGLVAFSLVTN
jgi:NADH:ubiquinone oxidoreductase subunit K